MINSNIKFFCLTLIIFLLLHKNSYAYLDMGTGSYILQIILGSIVGGIFWIKLYWQKIKTSINTFFKQKNNVNKKTPR